MRKWNLYGPTSFRQMLQDIKESSNDYSMKYYTIDEAWNICITKSRKVVVDGKETQYDVYEVKIPYKTMVTQYGMTFDFLMSLQIVTKNAVYVKKVADLTNDDSSIHLTIFDNYEIDKDVKTQ